MSEDPIGFLAEDYTLYRYAFNSPTIWIDPHGLDTYRQNRKLGGSEYKSNWNPLSHTFVFTTNDDGTLQDTYSWGNTANTNGWNKNQSEDIAAATAALKAADGLYKVGDEDLDDFIDKAFDELNNKDNEHGWRPWNNCKHEADRLIDKDKKDQAEAETE